MQGAPEPTRVRPARIWRDEAHLRRYRFVRSIATGGFGSVFLAQDTAFARHVAIKTLNHENSSPEIAAKFLNEAKALGSIDSPYVVKGYDQFREVDNGQEFVYLVMEYVEGEKTLATLIQDNPTGLPFEEARRLASELLLALDATHRKGHIHRDIKPGNVLLTLPVPHIGEPARVKLGDFGIARDIATVHSRSLRFGTDGYTPGEQSIHQGAWTDLFSFGAVFFRLLTGQDPFPTAQSSWQEVLIHRLPARKLSAVRPDLAMWTGLDELLADLLEHDHARRPQTAVAAKSRLDAISNVRDKRLEAEVDSEVARLGKLRKALEAVRATPDLARLEAASSEARSRLDALCARLPPRFVPTLHAEWDSLDAALAAARERIAFADFESALAARKLEKAEACMALLQSRQHEARARWIAAVRDFFTPVHEHVGAVLTAAGLLATDRATALASWRKLRSNCPDQQTLVRAADLWSRAGLPDPLAPRLARYGSAKPALEGAHAEAARAARRLWLPRVAWGLLFAATIGIGVRTGPEAVIMARSWMEKKEVARDEPAPPRPKPEAPKPEPPKPELPGPKPQQPEPKPAEHGIAERERKKKQQPLPEPEITTPPRQAEPVPPTPVITEAERRANSLATESERLIRAGSFAEAEARIAAGESVAQGDPRWSALRSSAAAAKRATVRQLLDTAARSANADPTQLLPELAAARQAWALDPANTEARDLVRSIDARMSLAWSAQFNAALNANDYAAARGIAARFEQTFPRHELLPGMKLRLSRERK